MSRFMIGGIIFAVGVILGVIKSFLPQFPTSDIIIASLLVSGAIIVVIQSK
jgi:hypothetical protein